MGSESQTSQGEILPDAHLPPSLPIQELLAQAAAVLLTPGWLSWARCNPEERRGGGSNCPWPHNQQTE